MRKDGVESQLGQANVCPPHLHGGPQRVLLVVVCNERTAAATAASSASGGSCPLGGGRHAEDRGRHAQHAQHAGGGLQAVIQEGGLGRGLQAGGEGKGENVQGQAACSDKQASCCSSAKVQCKNGCPGRETWAQPGGGGWVGLYVVGGFAGTRTTVATGEVLMPFWPWQGAV